MRRPRVAVDMTVGLFASGCGSAAVPASPLLIADTDALAVRPRGARSGEPPTSYWPSGGGSGRGGAPARRPHS